jgi:hypothetical protein
MEEKAIHDPGGLFFGDSFTHRLPIHILIDCSESMIGEPLDAVNQGIQQLCADPMSRLT